MFPDRFHDLLVDASHLEAGQYRFDQGQELGVVYGIIRLPTKHRIDLGFAEHQQQSGHAITAHIRSLFIQFGRPPAL